MSTRLYWTNLRNAANNMYRPIQSTYYWSVGRKSEYMREESNESNEHIEPSITSESDKPSQHCGTTCHRNRDSACSGTDHCHVNACKHRTDGECDKCKCFNCTCDKDRELPNKHGDSCTCPSCRDYNEYTEYTATIIDPERERSSTGIWIGNELRAFEQADFRSTNTTEHITGIPAGVTI